MNSKQFEIKIEVPVWVACHKRDDGSVSIDFVNLPDEDQIHIAVDMAAKRIQAGADVLF